ncbi:MAG TPA: hypothetical protein PKE47_00170 [Verrucomicrobiota bacterium]|nr:hypothetical protein [Verrucomicrobiota bacterium]
MRFPRLLLFAALAFAASAQVTNNRPAAGPVPEGWRLVYEQHFDAPAALDDFVFTDPAAWRHSAAGKAFALELAQQSRYQPPHRSPVNIALLAGLVLGDFILEVDLLQTGREYGHRDMCLFFGVQDPARFYYAHLATRTDPHAHNVFLVHRAARTNISTSTTPGVNWGLEVWQKVRLERRLADGSIRVFFNDMTTPVMTAKDTTFGAGWLGLGSFDDTGKMDNIRVWAPAEPERQRAEFFTAPPRP